MKMARWTSSFSAKFPSGKQLAVLDAGPLGVTMRLYAPKSAVPEGQWHVLSSIEQIDFGLRSAKKPTAPERAIRSESSGHSERAALGAFQCDLLGQHDVSDRQIAHRQKT